MRRFAASLVLLAACGPSAASPEAVFNTAKQAGQSKDWRTFYACFDPEKAPEMLLGIIMMAGFATMNDKEGEKELNSILARHNFDPEKQKSSGMGDAKQAVAAIKDPPGLFQELMSFSEKKTKKGGQATMDIQGDLTDLKVDGDKASATIAMKEGKKMPLHFVRRGGSWYVTSDRN